MTSSIAKIYEDVEAALANLELHGMFVCAQNEPGAQAVLYEIDGTRGSSGLRAKVMGSTFYVEPIRGGFRPNMFSQLEPGERIERAILYEGSCCATQVPFGEDGFTQWVLVPRGTAIDGDNWELEGDRTLPPTAADIEAAQPPVCLEPCLAENAARGGANCALPILGLVDLGTHGVLAIAAALGLVEATEVRRKVLVISAHHACPDLTATEAKFVGRYQRVGRASSMCCRTRPGQARAQQSRQIEPDMTSVMTAPAAPKLMCSMHREPADSDGLP